jgi:hypothetical protein
MYFYREGLITLCSFKSYTSVFLLNGCPREKIDRFDLLKFILSQSHKIMEDPLGQKKYRFDLLKFNLVEDCVAVLQIP